MTGKLALPSLIALCSIALGRPTLGSLAVLGEISISGTIMKVDELANTLQCCLDSGAGMRGSGAAYLQFYTCLL